MHVLVLFILVCFFSITSAGFFTILYSLEWGKEKANEWLTTFLLSFFQSVIVVQPVKVGFSRVYPPCSRNRVHIILMISTHVMIFTSSGS